MFDHKGHPAKAKPHEPSQGQQAFSCRILKRYQQRSLCCTPASVQDTGSFAWSA